MRSITNRRLWHACVAIAAGVACCPSGWAAGAEPADSEHAKARLAAVRAHIAEIANRLGGELEQRDALSARLREAELLITVKRLKVEGLRAQQLAAQRRQAELRAEQQRDQSQLQAQRSALAAQLRTAYMIGRGEQFKLLLNQSNPATLGRTLTYYGYFAAARTGRIDNMQRQVVRLQQVVDELERQNAQLAALERDARREVADLERARAARADLFAALNHRVAASNQQLADLKREEQAVESLVADLARVLQDFPLDASQGFDRMRGRLPWPVLGRVIAHYQEPHGNSAPGVRWNGELIEAARGAKVRAAYFGRVIYADWLQGLGLLLIIGHNGGYMTLYGHAEVLYKSVGDWVAPGDVIAALSEAGGSAPQLYFEIRDGRKTVDPKVWLKSTP
jgi:murein hydrolase activator